MISHEDLNPQKHYCENVKTCKVTDARSEVHTVVLLGSHIFCTVTPYHGLSGSQHVRGSMSLKNLRNLSPKMPHYITEDLNLEDD